MKTKNLNLSHRELLMEAVETKDNGVLLLKAENIDTSQKKKELIQTILETIPIKKEGLPLRLVSEQIDLVDENWIALKYQHLLLSVAPHLKMQWAHIIFPTEQLVLHREKLPEIARRSFNKLCHLLNGRGLLHYTTWIKEQIHEILQKINLESAEEYTLESTLTSFVHEVDSVLLSQKLVHQLNLVTQLYDLEFSEESAKSTLSIEKELIKSWEEVSALLCIQYERLREIQLEISTIQRNHPELIDLKMNIDLFLPILGAHLEQLSLDWCQEQILFHLLNERLHVQPIIHGNKEDSRCAVLLALRKGLHQLLKFYPAREIVEAASQRNFMSSKHGIALKEFIGKELKQHQYLNPRLDSSKINPDLLAFFPQNFFQK